MAVFLKKFYKQQNRPLLLCLFLGAMFFAPVSGFITFNYQVISTTADRYAYPLLGSISILLAYVYSFALKQSPTKKIVHFAAGGLIVVLAASSFFQSQVWKNDLSFFENLLEGNPNSFHAHANLGTFRQSQGNYKEAIHHFEKANAINNLEVTPVVGLMISYLELGENKKLNELVLSYCQDHQLKKMNLAPTVFIAFRICADVYQENQQFDQALMFYCRAAQQSSEAKTELAPAISALQKNLNKKCEAYPVL